MRSLLPAASGRPKAPSRTSNSRTAAQASPNAREVISGRSIGRSSGGSTTPAMRPGRAMSLAPIHNVSPEVARRVEAVYQEVVRGKAVPEIVDKIVVP